MQTVGQNFTQRTSLDALQMQMDQINQRFSNIESVLQQSFQSILGVLSQQKTQIDGMSVTLGNFKQDSLAMSQQIRSLLFSKKNRINMSLVHQDVEPDDYNQKTKSFSNGFQLNNALNQIKISDKRLQQSNTKLVNGFDISEEIKRKTEKSQDNSILCEKFKKGLQISFEPVEDNWKNSLKATPLGRGKSLINSRQSFLRFETPQGVKEKRNSQAIKKRDPPKLKNRSVISKKNVSGTWGKNKKIKMIRRKKQILRKANLNLLADKLGKLEFGNEDLKSRESDSFQDKSHFLDRVSQDNSKTSLRDKLESNRDQNSLNPPSLGIFGKTPTQSDNFIFNFPRSKSSTSKSFDQQVSINNIKSRNGELSIVVPSLHLESMNKGSCKFENSNRKELRNNTTADKRNKRQMMRTPSIGQNPNLSIFSVNRKQAVMNISNQMKMVPFLPNLQSEIKTEKESVPQNNKMVPHFNFNMEDSENISNQGNNLLYNEVINYQKSYAIRDPLEGEKTPSSINHSKLQKNLNAIQFDFSYHTGYETKESIPEFAHFESKESSRYHQSKFDITPQQNQMRNDPFGQLSNKNPLNRNWSINPIPKSAYLNKVRTEFPEMKNGLKLNEKGQMSIDDSAFSTEMNLKFLNVNTVKSSLNKLGIKEKFTQNEQQMCWNNQGKEHKINKKLDFEEENDNMSVRTMNQISSRKQLPDFECSGFDASMFSADLNSKDSHITRKQNENEEHSYGPFNLREELQKLPNNDFFGMDFKVPGIQNQANDSQFNMSLLEQLDFKDDYVNKSISTNMGYLTNANSSTLQQKNPCVEKKSEELEFENNRFENILKELKTQLDAAHYQMFDSKFDTKFQELTRKLHEYCLLDSDVHRVDSILKENNRNPYQEELQNILSRRKIMIDSSCVMWTEKLEKVCQGMQTKSFEESLRKLMRDPSGFNSFLILVKKRLSEQEILFQNSF
jgi:hypothetical protein